MITYQTLTQHVVPGPQSASYFAPPLLLATALLIPRARLSRRASSALFLPPIVACTAHAWAQMGALDVLSADLLLWSVFLLALHDPWRDFRRVRWDRVDGKGCRGREKGRGSTMKDEPPQSVIAQEPWPKDSLLARLRWVGVLLVSIRLEGWTIGRGAHDRRQPIPPTMCVSRMQYFRRALLSIARGFIVLDLTSAFVARDAYFTDAAVPISSPLPPSVAAFTALPLPTHSIRAAVIGAQAWALLSQLAYLGFLPLVALNALGILPESWSPHACRPFFGPGRALLTRGLRGFWGTYWHQAMRHMVSGPGEAAADALRLRAGSVARGAVVSAAAFALSGVVHMGLVPPRPPLATVSAGAVRVLVARFFWVQPLGMLVEDLVVRAWSEVSTAEKWRAGWRLWCRCVVNVVWLGVWFAACLPLLGDFGRQMGYWRVWLVPVSVWKGIRGEGWMAW